MIKYQTPNIHIKKEAYNEVMDASKLIITLGTFGVKHSHSYACHFACQYAYHYAFHYILYTRDPLFHLLSGTKCGHLTKLTDTPVF